MQTRGELDVAGSMFEHPDAILIQNSLRVNADLPWGSLDHENWPRGDVFNRKCEVGEEGGDGGRFKGCAKCALRMVPRLCN